MARRAGIAVSLLPGMSGEAGEPAVTGVFPLAAFDVDSEP
jgi:hypothetical protein